MMLEAEADYLLGPGSRNLRELTFQIEMVNA